MLSDVGAPRSEHRGWYSRGYLPHLDSAGVTQHVTFRLADSLPVHALAQLDDELHRIPEARRDLERRIRVETLADAGHGCCLLRQPWAAKLMQEALLFHDGERYRLLAWVVMPNHVHVLFEPDEGRSVDGIVRSWRGYTGHRLASSMPGTEVHNGSRRVWQRGYWDRFIRNEAHYWSAVAYIEANPVTAGLAARPEDWPWSSAPRRS